MDRYEFENDFDKWREQKLSREQNMLITNIENCFKQYKSMSERQYLDDALTQIDKLSRSLFNLVSRCQLHQQIIYTCKELNYDFLIEHNLKVLRLNQSNKNQQELLDETGKWLDELRTVHELRDTLDSIVENVQVRQDKLQRFQAELDALLPLSDEDLTEITRQSQLSNNDLERFCQAVANGTLQFRSERNIQHLNHLIVLMTEEQTRRFANAIANLDPTQVAEILQIFDTLDGAEHAAELVCQAVANGTLQFRSEQNIQRLNDLIMLMTEEQTRRFANAIANLDLTQVAEILQIFATLDGTEHAEVLHKYDFICDEVANRYRLISDIPEEIKPYLESHILSRVNSDIKQNLATLTSDLRARDQLILDTENLLQDQFDNLNTYGVDLDSAMRVALTDYKNRFMTIMRDNIQQNLTRLKSDTLDQKTRNQLISDTNNLLQRLERVLNQNPIPENAQHMQNELQEFRHRFENGICVYIQQNLTRLESDTLDQKTRNQLILDTNNLLQQLERALNQNPIPENAQYMQNELQEFQRRLLIIRNLLKLESLLLDFDKDRFSVEIEKFSQQFRSALKQNPSLQNRFKAMQDVAQIVQRAIENDSILQNDDLQLIIRIVIDGSLDRRFLSRLVSYMNAKQGKIFGDAIADDLTPARLAEILHSFATLDNAVHVRTLWQYNIICRQIAKRYRFISNIPEEIKPYLELHVLSITSCNIYKKLNSLDSHMSNQRQRDQHIENIENLLQDQANNLDACSIVPAEVRNELTRHKNEFMTIMQNNIHQNLTRLESNELDLDQIDQLIVDTISILQQSERALNQNPIPENAQRMQNALQELRHRLTQVILNHIDRNLGVLQEYLSNPIVYYPHFDSTKNLLQLANTFVRDDQQLQLEQLQARFNLAPRNIEAISERLQNLITVREGTEGVEEIKVSPLSLATNIMYSVKVMHNPIRSSELSISDFLLAVKDSEVLISKLSRICKPTNLLEFLMANITIHTNGAYCKSILKSLLISGKINGDVLRELGIESVCQLENVTNSEKFKRFFCNALIDFIESRFLADNLKTQFDLLTFDNIMTTQLVNAFFVPTGDLSKSTQDQMRADIVRNVAAHGISAKNEAILTRVVNQIGMNALIMQQFLYDGPATEKSMEFAKELFERLSGPAREYLRWIMSGANPYRITRERTQREIALRDEIRGWLADENIDQIGESEITGVIREIENSTWACGTDLIEGDDFTRLREKITIQVAGVPTEQQNFTLEEREILFQVLNIIPDYLRIEIIQNLRQACTDGTRSPLIRQCLRIFTGKNRSGEPFVLQNGTLQWRQALQKIRDNDFLSRLLNLILRMGDDVTDVNIRFLQKCIFVNHVTPNYFQRIIESTDNPEIIQAKINQVAKIMSSADDNSAKIHLLETDESTLTSGERVLRKQLDCFIDSSEAYTVTEDMIKFNHTYQRLNQSYLQNGFCVMPQVRELYYYVVDDGKTGTDTHGMWLMRWFCSQNFDCENPWIKSMQQSFVAWAMNPDYDVAREELPYWQSVMENETNVQLAKNFLEAKIDELDTTKKNARGIMSSSLDQHREDHDWFANFWKMARENPEIERLMTAQELTDFEHETVRQIFEQKHDKKLFDRIETSARRHIHMERISKTALVGTPTGIALGVIITGILFFVIASNPLVLFCSGIGASIFYGFVTQGAKYASIHFLSKDTSEKIEVQSIAERIDDAEAAQDQVNREEVPGTRDAVREAQRTT